MFNSDKDGLTEVLTSDNPTFRGDLNSTEATVKR